MAGKQQGQILYLAGSTSSHGNPAGSLSTRFQKLSQSRSTGITVVNSTAETRPSGPTTGLGLGRKTGSRPTGPGQRLVSSNPNSKNPNNNNNSSKAALTNVPRGGLHTAGGLARAMQERGTGVTDEFLLAPTLHLGVGGQKSGGGGPVRGGPVRGGNKARGGGIVGGLVSGQASRHKSLVLGQRPSKVSKQNGSAAGGSNAQQPSTRQQGQQPPRQVKVGKANGAGAGTKPTQQQQQQQQQGGKKKGVVVGKAKGPKAKGKGKSKPGAAAAAATAAGPASSENLDSELNEYMMKNEHTAASQLDNDLDMYMADRPEDSVW
ncbi:hypothetical protein B0O80DRAFT_526539 [Mortierella sp. GBAus27b]|nr:hypothetical protein B0O80DRAFT_526539 [Mortierella sp. GBAus27b]